MTEATRPASREKAPMTGPTDQSQVQFKEVNASGVFTYRIDVNHVDSMALLRQNGLRPLTYKEALVLIDKNPELKRELKHEWEDTWFYLEGSLNACSGFYTFNEKGELTPGKGDVSKTILVWGGNRPLQLHVSSDMALKMPTLIIGKDERYSFRLDTIQFPAHRAPIVVGVKMGKADIEAELKAAAEAKLRERVFEVMKVVRGFEITREQQLEVLEAAVRTIPYSKRS
jgi:hypothetical protein